MREGKCMKWILVRLLLPKQWGLSLSPPPHVAGCQKRVESGMVEINHGGCNEALGRQSQDARYLAGSARWGTGTAANSRAGIGSGDVSRDH